MYQCWLPAAVACTCAELLLQLSVPVLSCCSSCVLLPSLSSYCSCVYYLPWVPAVVVCTYIELLLQLRLLAFSSYCSCVYYLPWVPAAVACSCLEFAVVSYNTDMLLSRKPCRSSCLFSRAPDCHKLTNFRTKFQTLWAKLVIPSWSVIGHLHGRARHTIGQLLFKAKGGSLCYNHDACLRYCSLHAHNVRWFLFDDNASCESAMETLITATDVRKQKRLLFFIQYCFSYFSTN